MDFEWDTAKEQANRRKHGIDFRTAAKLFLDPYVIEFDDFDNSGELRFNAIGLVDGRMLFVTYALRGDVVPIIYPPEERNQMKKANITSFRTQSEEAAEERLARLRCDERGEAPPRRVVRSGLSASQQGSARSCAPRADGGSFAQEIEADTGGIRGAVSSPTWDRARLGAGRPSAR